VERLIQSDAVGFGGLFVNMFTLYGIKSSACMVDASADYPWFSYAYNILREENSLIKPHELYLALGSLSLSAVKLTKRYLPVISIQISLMK